MASNISRRTAIGALAVSYAALRIPSARAAETLRVGKSVVENIGFLPLDIGIQNGIFDKQGLTIEAINFGGAARLHQATIANDVDIGLSAGPEMAFVAKGAPEIAVGAIAESPMFMAYCVGANSTAQGIDDLKGKRIAITSTGSLTEWLVDELNRFKGWTAEGDRAVKVTIGGETTSAIAAIKTNQVDATISSLQVGYLFEEQKVGRPLFDCSQYVKALEFNTIFASNPLVHDNPDTLRRFLQGWYEAVAFMKAHKDETVRIGAKVMNDPPPVVARTYDSLMARFSTDGKFNPAAIETLRASFVALKTLNGPVDMTKLYTEQFLPKNSAA